MRDDELEDELRPARAVDLRRPRRQRVARKRPDQGSLPERAVDDDPDAAIAREREDAGLDLAVEHVVGDLDEIEPLAAHDLLDLAMAATLRGRDADVAELPGRLHRGERRQVLTPSEKVV